MATAAQEGGLWRPANGTDGQDFEHHWCRHCLNRNGDGDWEDEFGNDITGWCMIAESMFWAHPSPELVVRDGMPWCKAFRQDLDQPARCLFTKEMEL